MGILNMRRFRPLRYVLGTVLIFSLTAPSAHAMGRNPKELKPYNPKKFEIHLKVDFGPAGKPAYEENLLVEEDTTAKEAVSQVFPIRTGSVCCSLRDVAEIGGVSVEPEKNRWWICLRNGSKNFSPRRDKLKPGDKIEWKYIGDPDAAKKA